jgi:hypothetical protein
MHEALHLSITSMTFWRVSRRLPFMGVHRGATVALATTQVQTGHDLISMEHGFLASDDPDTHEDLIDEFKDVAAEIMDIIPAQDVVNKVFK